MQKLPPPPYFVLRCHEGNVTALHFTKEVDHIITYPTLISGSDIGEIYIWNLKTNRTLHRFSGHEKKMIMFLHYFKSSLLSQGRDGVLNVWDYSNQQWTIIRRFSSNNVGFCASVFYPVEETAQLVLLNEDKHLLQIYDYRNENKVKELKMKSDFGMCMCIKAFQMDNKTFLLTGYENGCIGLWDSKSEIAHTKFHKEPVMCLDFDSQHRNKGISGSVDEFLETWTITDSLQICRVKTVTVTNRGINAIKIREDGKVVLTAGQDSNIRVFSWKTLQPLAVLKFHGLAILCLACYPTSTSEYRSVFASGSKDQNIALWSLY